MSVRRSVASVALSVILAGLLGACGADEPAPAVRAADPAPAPHTPPSPTPTVDPDQESPQSFIRRWAKAEADMHSSGDPTEYRALSQGCSSCVELAEKVEGYYTAGGHVEWRGWEILGIEPWSQAKDHFKVAVRSAPMTYAEFAGGPEQSIEGAPGLLLLALRADGTSWVVSARSELAQ